MIIEWFGSGLLEPMLSTTKLTLIKYKTYDN